MMNSDFDQVINRLQEYQNNYDRYLDYKKLLSDYFDSFCDEFNQRLGLNLKKLIPEPDENETVDPDSFVFHLSLGNISIPLKLDNTDQLHVNGHFLGKLIKIRSSPDDYDLCLTVNREQLIQLGYSVDSTGNTIRLDDGQLDRFILNSLAQQLSSD